MPRVLRGLLLLGILGSASADPDGVVIAGATGKTEAANGRYFSTDIVYNGHNCFKKEHVKLWLCMDSNSLWNVQVEEMRGGKLGILVSTARDVPSPLDAGPWKVWSDDSDSWAPDAAVSVTAFDPPQPGVAEPVPAGPLPVYAPPTIATEDAKLRYTIATMLFGAFVLGMISMSLATSMDPHVRSFFHKQLSATMAFLILLLVSDAIWTLLFERFFTAPFPFGLGLGSPVKPGVKIVIGFTLFTLSYMSLTLIAWKCQFSRARLYVVRTLGAHSCACFGIFAFTVIQHEAVFVAYAQFEGNGLSADGAKKFTAFLVTGMAWFTFLVYRWASEGAQVEVFKQPPLKPWPAPSEPPVTVSGPARRPESCTNLWATQPPPLIAKKPGPNWGEFVTAAEDEAAVIVLGYLVNQSITFCKTGELPGLQMVYTFNSAGLGMYWILQIVGLLFLLSVVMFIRSRYGAGGRAGSIINRTMFMSVSWCTYGIAKWATADYLKDNKPLLAVQGAWVVTIVAIALMLLLDKILDCILGSGNPLVRELHSSFGGPDGMSLLERAMRIVMNCTGMLVALAWDLAFTVSVETTVHSTDFLADHVVISKAVIFLAIGLLMFYPWRRIILPVSEMSEAHIEESIKHERLQMNRAEDFVPISEA